MKKKISLIVLMVAVCGMGWGNPKPKVVACVGDSITAGYGIPAKKRDTHSYPAVLGNLLGSKYKVVNLGASGRTLLREEDMAWVKTGRSKQLKNLKPDIFILMLGTNDSKKKHWIHKDSFERDLEQFIADFKQINKSGKIYLCLPPPAFDKSGSLSDGDSISGVRIRKEIIPIIKEVAKKHHLETIDIFSAMRSHPELFSDGVHPNEKGAAILAKIIQQKIQ